MNIALGTIPFGTAVNEQDTFAILDRFAEAGGTMLDTSNNYPFWAEGCSGDESELAIGAWLAARNNRDQVFISTKVGAKPMTAGDKTLHNVDGLSASAINRGIEGSLRRLGTDHVDLYWSHIEDRSVPLEETVEAFDLLVRYGKVGRVGASNLPTWRLERARAVAASRGLTPYTYVQVRHSYLRPRPGSKVPESGHVHASDELLGYVHNEPDLTLWAYSTLISGAYTAKPLPEAYEHAGTTARLKALHEVSAELGATPNQVVLAWLIADGYVPIVGVSSLAQVEEAIGASDLKLDDAMRARLDV